MIRIGPLAVVLLAAACGARIGPVPLAAGQPCEYCRMTIENPTLAAQVVASAEEPRFFDDIGCMAAWLEGQKTRPEGQMAFVADHRTKEWVPVEQALFTRAPRVATPMDSHLIAHRSEASRDADSDAAGGQPVSFGHVLSGRLAGGAR